MYGTDTRRKMSRSRWTSYERKQKKLYFADDFKEIWHREMEKCPRKTQK